MSLYQAESVPALAGEYCNVLALQRELDPTGHADSFEDLLLLEAPLPWRRELYEVAGALPQQAIDLYALWLQRYQAGQPYNHRAVLLAPDPQYSQPGCRRVMYYTRPQAAFSYFPMIEYLVPEDEAGALIWAICEDHDRLPAFERFRLRAQIGSGLMQRDILVCTHGTVDVACAKFGYPLYRYMRDHLSSDEVRVWHASHFGGHVFAPTLIDMPTGHFWAYVGAAQAQKIVQRHGDVNALRGHLRGWAGLQSSFEQAADCALWQREGWDWFECERRGDVIVQEEPGQRESEQEEPAWAKVRINYIRPNGVQDVCTALVDVTHRVATRPSTGDDQDYGYPQYAVAFMPPNG